MKTPLEQLIQWLDPIHQSVIDKATELLKEEKEQMRKIYDGVRQNVGTSIKKTDLPTFEDWYNHNYKK